jgi:hypothetical protein
VGPGIGQFVLTILGSLLILTGCGGKKPEADPVVARVGMSSATRSQLQTWYSLPVSSDSAAAPALEEAARDWAMKEILVQETLRRGLDQDTLFLARMQNLRRELLVGLLNERAAAALAVDSSEVIEEYNKNRTEYLVPADQVDLVYILAPSREAAGETRQFLQNGLTLAGILAANPSLTGQAVGWVSQNDLDPVLARAVFALVPGGISYPQKRDDGRYVLLQARQRRLEGTVKSLDEIYGEVYTRILMRKQAEAEKALRDSLWATYRPQISINQSTIVQN